MRQPRAAASAPTKFSVVLHTIRQRENHVLEDNLHVTGRGSAKRELSNESSDGCARQKQIQGTWGGGGRSAEVKVWGGKSGVEQGDK
ncbi:MAG: hypothetical protein BJ554DRAFT_5583 [Olpidium bornovanus]|uniref:Uncharacterized protein n=1 Tax=Olpidium bornovanus TaxID=278681 RepID=A0A8H7ZZD9_9FUNG|nr:MAG: hypothetical protein BJ554DRAFT_5583 [Olpidium bornovanus]